MMFCCKKWCGNQERYLYAFDFDHTIIDDNSDTAINSVLTKPIPDDIKLSYNGSNWTAYMGRILDYAAANGADIESLRNRIRRLQLVPGMELLLRRVSDNCAKFGSNCHWIIVSDSNEFFIKTRLEAFDPPLAAMPNAYITNSAFVNEDGQLRIAPYEDQTTCQICPKNLCKGAAIDAYLKESGPFDNIFYVGDGGNDLCAAQHLRDADIVFVRKGFGLEKIIQKGTFRNVEVCIKANVIYFDDAFLIEKFSRFYD